MAVSQRNIWPLQSQTAHGRSLSYRASLVKSGTEDLIRSGCGQTCGQLLISGNRKNNAVLRSNRLVVISFCMAVMVLIFASHAASAATNSDDLNSLLLMTPAQLYRLDGAALSAEVDADRASDANHAKFIFGRKASPSLYSALRAQIGSHDNLDLGGDGAFKILDKIVLGIGFDWAQGPWLDASAATQRALLSSQAIVVKDERYEVGAAMWQLRLSEHASAALLHGRWWITPTLALGGEARQAPRFTAGLRHQRWTYALNAAMSWPDWELEGLLRFPAHDTAGAAIEPAHGALRICYRVQPNRSMDVQVMSDLGRSPEQSRVQSTSWYRALNGPSAGHSLGVGYSQSL